MQLMEKMHRMNAGQKRGARRGTIAWVSGFIVTLVIIGIIALIQGKAFAQCVAGSNDVTCPSKAVFAKKYHNGYFNRASGVPVKKVLNTPGKDHDKYVKKYVHMWNNAGPTKRSKLHAYASSQNNKVAIRLANSKWMHGSMVRAAKRTLARTGKVVAVPREVICQEPLTPECAASINWTSLVAGVKCGMWHSYPDTTSHLTCDRFVSPRNAGQCGITSCDAGLTWAQFRDGVKVTACAVGTGLAGFAAVASEGAGVPLLGMFTTGSVCAVTLAEAVS